MAMATRTTLLALKGVEDALRLGFEGRGLGGVVSEDEGTGDEADDEGDCDQDEGGHVTDERRGLG